MLVPFDVGCLIACYNALTFSSLSIRSVGTTINFVCPILRNILYEAEYEYVFMLGDLRSNDGICDRDGDVVAHSP